MRTLRSALTSLGRAPVKSSVMLATVGLGVTVLIFALSISTVFARLIAERLEGGGFVVMVEVKTIGIHPPAFPAHYRQQITDTLLNDIVGVAAASTVGDVFLTSYLVGQDTYEIRSVLRVDETYLDVMQLELVAGSHFTAGGRDALVSESLAELLFGSPFEALGQPLQTAQPRVVERRGDWTEVVDSKGEVVGFDDFIRKTLMHLYTIRGVFADPDELRRRAYGIADMLLPPLGHVTGDGEWTSSRYVFALRVTAGRFATVESQVRSALAAQFDQELAVEVWEGGPHHTSGVLEEVRSTVRTFSLVVNLLGVLLLATGCVGLLSLMAVEVLSRSRQIALSRAFGAAKAVIVREFLARSLIMMGASSALGVTLSLFLSAPLTDLVVPIFQDLTQVELTGPVITPAAVVMGVAASLGIGGVLGTLPVFSALSAPIAEGIRD